MFEVDEEKAESTESTDLLTYATFTCKIRGELCRGAEVSASRSRSHEGGTILELPQADTSNYILTNPSPVYDREVSRSVRAADVSLRTSLYCTCRPPERFAGARATPSTISIRDLPVEQDFLPKCSTRPANDSLKVSG